MFFEQIQQILLRTGEIYSTQIPIIAGLGILFTVFTIFESQTASPGKVWWRNPGLGTDISYALIHAVLMPYFRIPGLVIVTLLLSAALSKVEIDEYFKNGRGLFAGFSFWQQALIYLLLTDFLLYWIHRLFHSVSLWRFHAIHHSAEQVDWTTSYRFHPVNLMLQPSLVGVLMLTLGISPAVMAFFVPWDILSAAFVHANIKWTFGPLKYIVATPVFHRWHHGPPDDGGSSNFAPTFAFYDVLFGTFYLPVGRLPQNFGIDDANFPKGYIGQVLYPIAPRLRERSADAEKVAPN